MFFVTTRYQALTACVSVVFSSLGLATFLHKRLDLVGLEQVEAAPEAALEDDAEGLGLEEGREALVEEAPDAAPAEAAAVVIGLNLSSRVSL